jgi:hypothetical protein
MKAASTKTITSGLSKNLIGIEGSLSALIIES